MIKTILYVIAGFLLVLIVIGLILNFIPIDRPLGDDASAILILSTTMVCATLFFANLHKFNKIKVSIPKTLMPFFLLPVLAVIGAKLVNDSNSNLVLMGLMVLIAVVPLIAMFTKWIPEEHYGLVIWMVSLSLILHRALISQNLTGSDVVNEYAVFRNVAINGRWNPDATNIIPSYNTSLAITILPQMISRLFMIDGFWIFKTVFPVILSLIPLAVYEIIKGQFSNRMAFLSTFFIMAGYTFYTTFLSVDKQIIATFFFVVFVMAVLDEKLNKKAKFALMLSTGLGIVVSHYSMAFLFIGLIGLAYIGGKILRRPQSLNLVICAVLVVACAGYYTLVGHGVILKLFGWMGDTAITTTTVATVTTIEDPNNELKIEPLKQKQPINEAQRVLSEGSASLPPSMRYVYIFTQVLTVLGYLYLALRWLIRKERNIKTEYIIMGFILLALLASELVLPKMANVVALDRIYLVCLIFLAPYFLTVVTFEVIKQPVFAAVFLVAFTLMNTGFVYQLIGQPLATSIALSQNEIDFPVYTDKEVEGARWVIEQAGDNIYYDCPARHLFDYIEATSNTLTGHIYGNLLWRKDSQEVVIEVKVPQGAYIYLRKYNITHQKLSVGWAHFQVMDTRQVDFDKLGDFSNTLLTAKVVYENEDCRVLRTTREYAMEVK